MSVNAEPHFPNSPEIPVPFPFEEVFTTLDGQEPSDPDDEFWSLESQLLVQLLSWLAAPKTMPAVGARVYTLLLYLRPELLRESSLREISQLPGAPTRQGLSKALLDLEARFGLKPSPIQKPRWTRERFSRSARIAHRERKTPLKDSQERSRC